jgi:PAS domain S-box-containing protein
MACSPARSPAVAGHLRADAGVLVHDPLTDGDRATEPRFRALATSAPVGIYELDAAGGCVFVNEHWCELAGVDADTALGRGWMSVIHPDDLGRVVAEWTRASEEDREFVLEYRYLRPDGEVVWIVGRAIAVRDEHGEVASYLGTADDITARRDEERERQALAALVRASTDAIIGKDLDGVITSWNPGAERIYGYSAEEAIGHSIELLVPKERRIELPKIMERIGDGEAVEIVETERIRKDGSRIAVALTISPVRDASGEVIGASTVARDISRRKLAERMLEDERRQLAEAQRLARVGSWEFDPASGQWRWSAQQFRNLGFDPSDQVPSLDEVFERVHPDDRDQFRQHVKAMSREGAEFEFVFDYRVMLDDGELRTLELRGGPAADDQRGSGRGFMGTTRDVTAERDAERLKDEFFNLVSHELRTPLTSIIGYAELLNELEAENLSEQGRRFVEVIERNSRRELNLVGDLLMLTRISAGTFEVEFGRADLAEIAEAAVETARPAAEKGELELVLERPDEAVLAADSHRLSQVTENLLSNAIKFTPEGGRVTVRVAREPGEVVLEVADTGIGIVKGEAARLFEPMYRAAEAERHHIQGTGLGLAIVKAIVDAHEGTIEVDGEPGVGTTFTVTLPAREPPGADRE